MMQERGALVGHSAINRWAIRFLPLIEKTFRKYKSPSFRIKHGLSLNRETLIEIIL